MLEELYAAVFADPRSDGPRQVLADALQEAGDPRGEFLSLQLMPRRSQRSERRMEKLLERHREAFLRGLAPIVMPGREKWTRGFLSEAAVVLEGLHVDVPDLATLERLEVFFSPAAPLELASPHMRSLREVSASLSAVPVLFDAPRPLAVETVALTGPGDLQAWPGQTVELLGEARSLPKLTRLTLSASRGNFDEAAWLWRMPVLPRLKLLEFDGSFRGLPLANLLGVLRTIERPPAAVVFQTVSVTLRLRAADRFRSLQVELEPPTGALVCAMMLDTLPPDALDDLAIFSSAPLDPSLQGSLRLSARRLELTNLALP
ncbi:MAG: TIGR02996 domain-containing protein [Myxococcota bacterium]